LYRVHPEKKINRKAFLTSSSGRRKEEGREKISSKRFARTKKESSANRSEKAGETIVRMQKRECHRNLFSGRKKEKRKGGSHKHRLATGKSDLRPKKKKEKKSTHLFEQGKKKKDRVHLSFEKEEWATP